MCRSFMGMDYPQSRLVRLTDHLAGMMVVRLTLLCLALPCLALPCLKQGRDNLLVANVLRHHVPNFRGSEIPSTNALYEYLGQIL